MNKLLKILGFEDLKNMFIEDGHLSIDQRDSGFLALAEVMNLIIAFILVVLYRIVFGLIVPLLLLAIFIYLFGVGIFW